MVLVGVHFPGQSDLKQFPGRGLKTLRPSLLYAQYRVIKPTKIVKFIGMYGDEAGAGNVMFAA